MKYALIANGMVDAISFEPQEDPWIEVGDEVFAGFLVSEDGGISAPLPDPAPVPNLTFPQLLFGLVTEGFTSEAEANDWLVRRILPPSVDAMISQLPGPQQVLVRARALQPVEVLREDPIINAFGASLGKSSDELDEFFRTYAGV